MMSQQDYDKEMNRRSALAEFYRRVTRSTQQTVATNTTNSSTNVNDSLGSEITGLKDSVLSTSAESPSAVNLPSTRRATHVCQSPSKIVKRVRKSEIAEQALIKMVHAYMENKFMTKAKTEFQKESRTNFQKHILIGLIIEDKNYLGAYQYFRSFFRVDLRSMFTVEDMHDIRVVSSALLEAHCCTCSTNDNFGELGLCETLVDELLKEFSFGQEGIEFTWKNKLRTLTKYKYEPDIGKLIDELTKYISRLEERITKLDIEEPVSSEEMQALFDAIQSEDIEDEEKSGTH